MIERQGERNRTAQRVAHDERPIDAEAVHDRNDQRALRGQRDVRAARRDRMAVAGAVDQHDSMSIHEFLQQRVTEIADLSSKSVNHDHGGARAAIEVVNAGAVHIQKFAGRGYERQRAPARENREQHQRREDARGAQRNAEPQHHAKRRSTDQ